MGCPNAIKASISSATPGPRSRTQDLGTLLIDLHVYMYSMYICIAVSARVVAEESSRDVKCCQFAVSRLR